MRAAISSGGTISSGKIIDSTKPDRDSQVKEWLKRTHERAQIALDNQHMLVSRLEVVLRNEPPGVAENKPPIEELVPLASELHELAEKFQRISDISLDIFHRLEI